MQDSAAEPGRLERVVAAFRDQRAADKGDPGDAKQQPQFAERIRQIDRRYHRHSASPQLRRAIFSPCAPEHLGDRRHPAPDGAAR